MKHIPKCETTEIEVLTFEDALKHTSQSEEYDRDRWIYVPDFYSEYRYILGTRGENPLICIGVNPSTAMPERLDNTLKSAQRIAKRNGFDSFIMFNVYAQRATVPDDMETEANMLLHKENMKSFEYVLNMSSKTSPPSIWAAWGSVIKKRAYLPQFVLDMVQIGQKYGAKWFTAGERSKDMGHPHHPLYLKSESSLDDFDVEEYCKKLIIKMKK